MGISHRNIIIYDFNWLITFHVTSDSNRVQTYRSRLTSQPAAMFTCGARHINTSNQFNLSNGRFPHILLFQIQSWYSYLQYCGWPAHLTTVGLEYQWAISDFENNCAWLGLCITEKRVLGGNVHLNAIILSIKLPSSDLSKSIVNNSKHKLNIVVCFKSRLLWCAQPTNMSSLCLDLKLLKIRRSH